MKKMSIIIVSVVLVYIAIRFMFSYTIITIPLTIGQVFEGGYKYDFPICVVNPIKTKVLKDSILRFVQKQLNDTIIPNPNNSYEVNNHKRFLWWFSGRLNRIPDIRIVAINNEKNRRCILLESIDNSEIRCIVFIDKKANKVLKIDF